MVHLPRQMSHLPRRMPYWSWLIRIPRDGCRICRGKTASDRAKTSKNRAFAAFKRVDGQKTTVLAVAERHFHPARVSSRISGRFARPKAGWSTNQLPDCGFRPAEGGWKPNECGSEPVHPVWNRVHPVVNRVHPVGNRVEAVFHRMNGFKPHRRGFEPGQRGFKPHSSASKPELSRKRTAWRG